MCETAVDKLRGIQLYNPLKSEFGSSNRYIYRGPSLMLDRETT